MLHVVIDARMPGGCLASNEAGDVVVLSESDSDQQRARLLAAAGYDVDPGGSWRLPSAWLSAASVSRATSGMK